MKIPISPPLDPARASFQTHLNYAKRLAHLLDECTIAVTPVEGTRIYNAGVERFRKLYDATRKSIKKDMELAREDHPFAAIAAPWFPVKCYYALYYLESILAHLLDGTLTGFTKGGHTAIRRKLCEHLIAGSIAFSTPELNRFCTLQEVEAMPPIDSGRNARATFWQEDTCTDSVLKKLTEYKLHDAKIGRKWNLYRPTDRAKRVEFVAKEHIVCLDLFYWYRIKANYRDLDYIDFENGITPDEVLDYMEAYYAAFGRYRTLLVAEINKIRNSSLRTRA